ncbi:hypothetical protein ACVWWK_005551 [Bradyrhizobium sp. LB9.1b]
MHGVKLFTGAAVSVLLLALAGPTPALADTIEAALVRAYQNNPQLNAQRAQARSTDENVPQALSGYRPKVNVTLGTGYQYQDTQQLQKGATFNGVLQPNSASLTVNPDALQRQSDCQQDARGGEPGLGVPRGVACARADGPAAGRHELHGLPA